MKVNNPKILNEFIKCIYRSPQMRLLNFNFPLFLVTFKANYILKKNLNIFLFQTKVGFQTKVPNHSKPRLKLFILPSFSSSTF